MLKNKGYGNEATPVMVVGPSCAGRVKHLKDSYVFVVFFSQHNNQELIMHEKWKDGSGKHN